MNLTLKKPFWIVCSFLWLVASCSAQSVSPTHTLTIKGETFHVALAKTEAERSRGLMEVKVMPQDQGMLFVFERPERLSFWMKNTPLPLSIAYISAGGEIKEIHDMTPFSLDPVPSRHAVTYALELNQGTFRALGITVGDKVEGLPQL